MQSTLWPKLSLFTGVTLLALTLLVSSGRHRGSLILKVRQLLLRGRKRMPEEEQVEEEQSKERQHELSLTAPPQILPLRTPGELLAWHEPWQCPPSASPSAAVFSSVRSQEHSYQSQALGTTLVDDARVQAAARARHNAFCAAPINSSLHNRVALTSSLASNSSDAHHQRSRQQGWAADANSASSLQDPISSPCLPSALSPMSATRGEAGAQVPGGQHVSSRPQLLVCHDMQGGYLDDRFVQGTSDQASFRLWRWDTIDTFVYFSHHLVTIPPPSWICAAHRNNTKVLGTFITEWAEGSKVCKQLFSSRSMAQQTADQLVRVARYHGFDGWLINIECELHPAKAYIPHLLHFLAHLRARMREVCGSHAAVIWYDAVTTEGHLRWQNSLTSLNYPFLDVSDGLFLNYHWKSETPAEVAAVAGSRACDVYMGVDVHGRGTFGGGKTACDVALLAARMSGVSAAIFAPGWVHENFPDTSEEVREDISETFWRRVVEAWGPRPIPQSAAPTSLPFITSFCEAKGRCHWTQGCCVSATPWHNLATLDLPPALLLPPSQKLTEGSAAASPTLSPPDLVLRKAWLALGALREGNTALQHSTSHSFHVSPHTFSQSSGSGPCDSNSAYKEGSVSLLRDLAFHGATCLLVQPPSSPCPSAPPLVHPLYHTHILVPLTGLALTYALTHPPSAPPAAQPTSSCPPLPAPSNLLHGSTKAAAGASSPAAPTSAPAPAPVPAALPAPHGGAPAGSTHPNLAIALWLRPTAASPANAVPCIAAVLPPSFASSSIDAFQAAGLLCMQAHHDGLIPSSSSNNAVGLSRSSGGIHQAPASANMKPWQLWQLRVDADALPFGGAAIVGVGIVCASFVGGAAHTVAVPDKASPAGLGSTAAPLTDATGGEAGGSAAVCLGHLALAAACIPCCPAPSPCLRSGLHASNITTLGLSAGEKLLSCDVSWECEVGLAGTATSVLQPLFSCYHVWVRGSNAHGTSTWLWLGIAHAKVFHCAVVVSSSSNSGSEQQRHGQQRAFMRVCRPHGHALHVLEGKAPAAGLGACAQEESLPQSVEIAVQPIRAVDGLTAGPVECCSQLRILLAQGSL